MYAVEPLLRSGKDQWFSQKSRLRSHGFLLLLLFLHFQSATSFGSAVTDRTSTPASMLISKGETITIDVAHTPDDLSAIQVCRQTAFPNNRPLLSSEQTFVNATTFARGRVMCLVARRRKAPSSVLHRGSSSIILGTLDLNPTTGTITNVFVRPDARGLGLARRLLAGAAAKTTVNALCLQVNTANTPAWRLYQSEGFVPDGPLHALTAWIGAANLIPSGLQVQLKRELSNNRVV